MVPFALGNGGGDATDSSGDTIDSGSFPQPGGVIGAGGGQSLPIRTERHQLDGAIRDIASRVGGLLWRSTQDPT